MISMRRISLGGGFRYLMESVARGDGAPDPTADLTAYYAASGTPPGRFIGAGLGDLDDGRGVKEGTVVTEDHLRNMLAACCDPITGRPVGRTPNAGAKVAPVAGFDLTFSPAKSISTAWALADEPTKAVIYDCHLRAVRYVLAYAEQEVCHSRSGTNGIIEEDITGLVGAAFTHWDSRAGDPQLHDHVVVWNRAKSVTDGKWRTLDSRGLYKARSALSAMHQGVLSDYLTQALGVGWDGRTRRHSSQPRWEITGVPDRLLREFSQRTEAVEREADRLIAQFTSAHGRSPTGVEMLKLRQQATLATRPDKTHRSLAEITDTWRQRASSHIDGDPTAWVATLRDRNDLPLLRAADLSEPMLADAASAVVASVAERRATFSRSNLLDDAHRILHGVRFAHPNQRVAVAERIAELAIERSLQLIPPPVHHTPSRYIRLDGSSRLHPSSHHIYTTHVLIDAEARLLDAGRTLGAATIAAATVAAVAEQSLPGRDIKLSYDQALAVERIATSGRWLDVLVGPAGTGKSTTTAGLRAAWESQHGPRSVLGLAPSAAAAEVLAEEIGIDTENTAKWLTEWRRIPTLTAARGRLDHQVDRHPYPASPSAQRLRRRVEEIDHAIDSRASAPRPTRHRGRSQPGRHPRPRPAGNRRPHCRSESPPDRRLGPTLRRRRRRRLPPPRPRPRRHRPTTKRRPPLHRRLGKTRQHPTTTRPRTRYRCLPGARPRRRRRTRPTSRPDLLRLESRHRHRAIQRDDRRRHRHRRRPQPPSPTGPHCRGHRR